MSSPIEFLIDWDNDGDFDGAEENVTERVDGDIGVVWSRGKDQIRQFASGVAGQLGFTLHNFDRALSPGNLSSPIVGLVLPGVTAMLGSTAIPTDSIMFEDGESIAFEDGEIIAFGGIAGRTIWQGLIYDIAQHPERDSKNVSFTCHGNLGRLRGKFVSTALYFNISTSEFLNHVLDEAGWPVDQRNIQEGMTILAQAWADSQGQDAFDIVQIIKNTEGPEAQIYEDADGFVVYENRESRTTQSRSIVSQISFVDTTNISGPVDNPPRFVYDPNYQDKIEAVVVVTNERQIMAQSIIWELGSDLVLTANQVVHLQVRANNDPFTDAVLPSAFPNDTVQTATADVILTAGTFKLRFRNETTASALDWDSTAAEWEAALESLSTIGGGEYYLCGRAD